jgi:hypothetical protein
MPPKRKTPPFKEPPKAKKPSKSKDRTTQLIADFGNLKSLNYTLFQPEPVNDFVAWQRKRPAKTSTSDSIVRIVFEDNLIKELWIPVFIDHYNHNIRGVDIANQLRKAYKTHKATRHNYWPLFYWLIDVVVINTYRLYRVHVRNESPLTHLEFRTALLGVTGQFPTP